ncbi:MAG: hypothetical protein ACR2OC_05820 [Solirubrobacterales bacterium]
MITNPAVYGWGATVLFVGLPVVVGLIVGWPNGTIGLLAVIGLVFAVLIGGTLEGNLRDRQRLEQRGH